MAPKPEQYAFELDRAAQNATAIAQLNLHESLDEEAAYRIQHEVVAHRVARGNPVIGLKLGFTNQAKAAQMGVFDVIAGSLTADMLVQDGGTVFLDELIHPRVEPELAFLLKQDVDLSDPIGPSFFEAVEAVAPALEIIDSRYEDFTFSLQDVIADNTSASKFVIGHWVPTTAASPDSIANLGVVLELDGAVAATGSTASILGNPIRAFEACCRMARAYGFTLPAGSILLAGAATVAVPIGEAGSITARVTGLGSAQASILGGAR